MKTTQQCFVKRALAVALQSAFAAMVTIPAAYAADAVSPEAADLINPPNMVQAGVGYVSEDSFKFGEYNGLFRQGVFGIGAFDIRGGAPYDSTDPFRWRIFGTDLGLDTRTLGGEVGNQGQFRLRYTYDELRRNFSDSFHTFYSGAGSTSLSIPAFASVPAASRLSSTATANGALANWQNIQAPYATAACAAIGGIPGPGCAGPGFLIPPAEQEFDLSTKRKKHDADFTYELTPNIQFKASVRHEEKEGNKLTGVAFGGPARGVLIPEPIDFTTDQFRGSLQWVDGRAFATIGYIGSLFKNGTNTIFVENPFNGNLLNPFFNNFAHVQGAPDNQMHQLHLDAGYNFSPTTRLVLSGNYQRLTQNESFTTLPPDWTIPATSPHAKVINTNLTATLTSKPIRNLAVTAQYKFEDRDNKTPSLNWIVSGGDAASAPALFTNRPLNFRTHQATLEGDYFLAARQAVKLGYDYKHIERTVEAVPPPPAELESPFRAEKQRENTWRVEYRNTFSPMLSGRVLYAYSERRSSEYEEGVLLPTPTVAPFPAADPLLPGFRQSWLADRNRNKVKGVLNVQASDMLSLQTSIEYNQDRYKNVQYGLQKNDSFVLNLDGGYAASDSTNLTAFYTFEDRKVEEHNFAIPRGNATTILDAAAFTTPCSGYFAAAGHLPSDLGTDPCRRWGFSQADHVHTFGIGAKVTGLLSERLEIMADLSYQYAKTPVNITGGTYFSNGSTAPAPAFNNIWIAAQPLPDITSKYLQLRLNGTYTLDKKSAVRLSYIFGHLKTEDWQWDAYANSTLGVLAVPVYPGPLITSPDYNVHVIGVSYLYSFR